MAAQQWAENRSWNGRDSGFSRLQPLPLAPMVRFSLLETLKELRGRTAFMALQGQMIDHIAHVEMVPPSDAAPRGRAGIRNLSILQGAGPPDALHRRRKSHCLKLCSPTRPAQRPLSTYSGHNRPKAAISSA